MEMEIRSNVEQVTKTDILGLEFATWNRERTSEELLGFIASKEANLQDYSEEL